MTVVAYQQHSQHASQPASSDETWVESRKKSLPAKERELELLQLWLKQHYPQ
jgi:hypothetical protein